MFDMTGYGPCYAYPPTYWPGMVPAPMAPQTPSYSPPPAQNTVAPKQNTDNTDEIKSEWVENEEAVQKYKLGPKEAVALWSKAKPVIYLLQADAFGNPYPVETYDLVKRETEPTTDPNQMEGYVKKMAALEDKVNALEAKAEILTSMWTKAKEETT